MSPEILSQTDYTKLAAEIVVAYVSNNTVPKDELPAIIASVHDALRGHSPAPAPLEPVKREPAVPVRKSITADYLICLEDGKPYRTLKRHLRKLGMTPDKYREKWGLPPDYPMVAQNYSKKRSALARDMGLGRPRGSDDIEVPEAGRLPSRTKPRRKELETHR
jgi:predicted transcriptional regulator